MQNIFGIRANKNSTMLRRAKDWLCRCKFTGQNTGLEGIFSKRKRRNMKAAKRYDIMGMEGY
jgi:hypothetical protein